jgi:hypothetical protein
MMFYVLYSPSTNRYMDEDYDLGTYEQAAKYQTSTGHIADAILRNARLYMFDAKWVGPCLEGEEP